MKKLVFFILLLSLSAVSAGAADIGALDGFGIDARAADNELYGVRAALFPEFGAEAVTGAIVGGSGLEGIRNIPNRVADIFFGELKSALKGALLILGVMILCSVITVFGGSFAAGEVSQTADAVCALSASLVMISVLKDVIATGMSAVSGGVSFVKALTPAMVILLFTGGEAASAGTLEFWLFFLIEAMSHAVEYVFIPLICCRLALSSADAVFDGVKLSGLCNLISGFLNFSLGLMLTVFTGFITLNRVVASIGDAAAGRTVKFTVSNAVPVVGKIISDAADLVISYSHIIKSAFGVFGIIGVVLIFLIPLIKIGAQLVVFKITAALSETLGNERLTKLLNGFAAAISYIFSLNVCVCVFMVISIGLTVSVGAK
ncbi:MAG: stage III sporulation protein AE [Clostridia bacterium]|nr:stage III sporulation protein AE [Clostridia bacterium]